MATKLCKAIICYHSPGSPAYTNYVIAKTGRVVTTGHPGSIRANDPAVLARPGA